MTTMNCNDANGQSIMVDGSFHFNHAWDRVGYNEKHSTAATTAVGTGHETIYLIDKKLGMYAGNQEKAPPIIYSMRKKLSRE